jgi:hypothetical protein
MSKGLLRLLHGHPLLTGGPCRLCPDHFELAFRRGLDEAWAPEPRLSDECQWPACEQAVSHVIEPYGADLDRALDAWREILGDVASRRVVNDLELGRGERIAVKVHNARQTVENVLRIRGTGTPGTPANQIARPGALRSIAKAP